MTSSISFLRETLGDVQYINEIKLINFSFSIKNVTKNKKQKKNKTIKLSVIGEKITLSDKLSLLIYFFLKTINHYIQNLGRLA